MPATQQVLRVTPDSRDSIAPRAAVGAGCLALALLAVPVWSQSPSSPSTVAATFSSAAETLDLSAAIIDMGLPDCGGDYVARHLRARRPTLPILICIGYDTAALAHTTAHLRVRLVEKPIDESSLVSTLREHIQNFGRCVVKSDRRAVPGVT